MPNTPPLRPRETIGHVAHDGSVTIDYRFLQWLEETIRVLDGQVYGEGLNLLPVSVPANADRTLGLASLPESGFGGIVLASVPGAQGGGLSPVACQGGNTVGIIPV